MEKYFEQAQGVLRLIQSTISKEEFENSTKAGMEMWDAIKAITEKYGLNVQEMLNATMSCHCTIIEVANEQLMEKKKEMES